MKPEGCRIRYNDVGAGYSDFECECETHGVAFNNGDWRHGRCPVAQAFAAGIKAAAKVVEQGPEGCGYLAKAVRSLIPGAK